MSVAIKPPSRSFHEAGSLALNCGGTPTGAHPYRGRRRGNHRQQHADGDQYLARRAPLTESKPQAPGQQRDGRRIGESRVAQAAKSDPKLRATLAAPRAFVVDRLHSRDVDHTGGKYPRVRLNLAF